MEYPANFERPKENVDITKIKDVIRSKPWIVYSDRKKNISSEKPGGKIAFYEFNFLTRFYVAAENRKKDSIMIVQDPEIDGLNFSKKAKNYGWVSKNNMLLWHNCLISLRGDLDKKAMIINKVDFIKSKDMPQKKFDIITFCEDPKLQYKTNKKSRMFHIRFVYKYDEKNKSLLLGTDSKMVGNRPWETILGWVPENRLTLWDTRICIEPNWEPKAAIERQQEKKKAMIFEDFKSAFSYQNSKLSNQESVFWDNDPFSDRNKGNWLRFPMLANIKNSTILHVGAMGNIVNMEGKEFLQRKEYDKFNMDFYKSLMELRNINVVFVVDATASMKPYFKPISNAIINSMQKMAQMKKNDPIMELNELRFGSVVYRDFPEKIKQKLVQHKELTSNYQEVASFINSVSAEDFYDSDDHEAMYHGLKVALRQIITNPNQTNFIVLIGDAGHHNKHTDVPIEDSTIINLLAEKKCHFLVYQSRNVNHPAYDDFIWQTKKIMEQSAVKIYKQIQPLSDSLNFQLKSVELQNIDKNIYKLKAANIGFGIYSELNKSMQTRVLEEKIEVSIFEIAKFVNSLLSKAKKFWQFGNISEETEEERKTEANIYVDDFRPHVLKLMQSIIPPENYNILKENKIQLYLQAYTPYQITGMKYPLYKYVLFLSRRELYDIITIMGDLDRATKSKDRREGLYKIWINILTNHIGDVNKKVFKEYTLEKAHKEIYRLISSSDDFKLIKDVKLKDITNRRVLNDRLFETYVSYIQKKYKGLTDKFDRQNNDARLIYGNDVFYWVEEDLLP